MSLQENIAETMRVIMKQQNKSLTEFSEELEVSRSAMQDYIKAKGNPSAKTIEHIANKLGITPIALMAGLTVPEQREITVQLLNTFQMVSELPEEKRIRFAELFLEMVKLWDQN